MSERIPQGFSRFLLYTMPRVGCHRCGVVAVEEVLWRDGKRTLTKAYMPMRKSYGFCTYRLLELALYHSVGKLPEPE